MTVKASSRRSQLGLHKISYVNAPEHKEKKKNKVTKERSAKSQAPKKKSLRQSKSEAQISISKKLQGLSLSLDRDKRTPKLSSRSIQAMELERSNREKGYKKRLRRKKKINDSYSLRSATTPNSK